MKKTVLLLSLALLAVALTSHRADAKPPKHLRTEMDSVAYAMGIDVGSHLRHLDSTMLKDTNESLNAEALMRGALDMMNGDERMDRETAFAFLNEFFVNRLPERQRVKEEEFLEEFRRDNPDYTETESGLMYKIVKPGDPSVMPTENSDIVTTVYEGRDRYGKIFDSSLESGDTVEFALNHVIRGWSEGIKLIGKGGHIKLCIPSELAYGVRGASSSIPPYSTLFFDVWLLDVGPQYIEESVFTGYHRAGGCSCGDCDCCECDGCGCEQCECEVCDCADGCMCEGCECCDCADEYADGCGSERCNCDGCECDDDCECACRGCAGSDE